MLMKYKLHDKIEYNCPIGSLLSDESMAVLNGLFGTHYTQKQFKKDIKVSRKREGFKFWDRLVRSKPGFDRGGNGT